METLDYPFAHKGNKNGTEPTMAATKAPSTAKKKSTSGKTVTAGSTAGKPATRKTAAPRATAAKSASAVAEAPPKPVLVAVSDLTPPAVEATIKSDVKTALKVRPLVDRVVKTTGAKKKAVKDIVEAVLAEIGDALSRGEDLNLPPLGKVKVNRQMDRNGADVLMIKINRGGPKTKAEKEPKEGLAEDGEDS